MNAFLSLGRWIFPVPFAVLGLLYFMNAPTIADNIIPPYLPFKIMWVYGFGAGFIGASVSMYTGKYDKLATTLLAVMLLVLVLLVHVPGAMAGGTGATVSMRMLLRDIGLMAASLLYAQNLAKDRSVVG